MSYRITRFFEDGHKRQVKIVRTLEKAREHCTDRRTSSQTAPLAVKLNAANRGHGEWFDGYEEVKS